MVKSKSVLSWNFKNQYNFEYDYLKDWYKPWTAYCSYNYSERPHKEESLYRGSGNTSMIFPEAPYPHHWWYLETRGWGCTPPRAPTRGDSYCPACLERNAGKEKHSHPCVHQTIAVWVDNRDPRIQSYPGSVDRRPVHSWFEEDDRKYESIGDRNSFFLFRTEKKK